ncbi:protein argonaute MEL1-like [Senna tora]|uniref:Protein argonaute MEL1-like n=1 Tax=Senna tora TaxID=362788 RepID=A0A834WLQ3_9FABA|nr:protein argonaute MEL1-like [Senna tora]
MEEKRDKGDKRVSLWIDRRRWWLTVAPAEANECVFVNGREEEGEEVPGGLWHNILGTELWGIVHGLAMAWQLGYRRIVVEVDSLVA